MFLRDVSVKVRRAARITSLLGGLLALLPVSTLASGSVTLAWDPSTDPTVVGYNIYYGAASRTYTNMISLGSVTNVTIAGLVEGVTYYFAGTTYDVSGLESDYSTEVSYTVPVSGGNQPPTLNPLGNLTINENAAAQTVNLSGITSGSSNEVQTLTVTSSSSNTGLLPNPTVTYISPNSTGTLTLKPATNSFGSATITVTVNDGGASNNLVSQTFTVTVSPVNQPPTLNGLGNLAMNENAAAQTVNLSGISSGAANENQTLSVTASSSNTGLLPNPTVTYTSPNSAGTLTLRPATNGFGSATITVTVNDGGTSNNVVSRTFTVTVNPVNQPPTLNALNNLAIGQNAGLQTVNLSGITSGATNENQTLTVTANSSNTGVIPAPTINYTSPSATGTLTFTPAANASGSATITVTVNDGGTSNNVVSRTFTVTVNAVNQQPTLNALNNLVINENAGQQTVNLSGITSGATNENQTLTVTASSSNTALIPTPAVIYTSPNTNGSLTFTPAANGFGSATITVTVNDGGASNNVVSRNFTVTVNPVNQSPTLNPLNNLVINQNAGVQTVNLSGITSGAANENQTLTVTASSSNTGIASTPTITYTSPGTTGTLTFTPGANVSGSATITVTVNDGGASNNIISRTFTVTIDQPPTITGLTNLVIAMDSSAGPLPFVIGDFETPAANLTLSASSSDTTLVPTNFIQFGGSDSNRTLLVTPSLSQTGYVTITITVSDGLASATNAFQLGVLPKPAPPANFHVLVSGSGTLSPNLSAQALVPGKSYTVTAVPAAGQEFAGWSGSLNSSQTRVTFLMTSNFVLQANFIKSPFIPKQGSYNGLFYEADAVRQYSSGALAVTTAKHGTYSGRLQLGGARYSFSGHMNLQLSATNTIVRRGLSSLTVELSLGNGPLGDQLTGRVASTDGAWSANLSGDRFLFNSRTNPAPWAGTYTMVLPAQTGDPGLPDGNGFGSARVSASGLVSLAATLADGTKVSQSAPLSQGGLWPAYVPLYSGTGSLLSWLAFTNRTTDDFNGAWSWIKPMNTRARYYPAGLTNVCLAQGSAYLAPATRTNTLLTFTNANLVFAGGNLAADFTNSISLGLYSRVTNHDTNRLSLAFSLSRGTFSGHVTDPLSGKSSSFSGAVLQKLNAGYGLLIGTNQTSSVTLSD